MFSFQFPPLRRAEGRADPGVPGRHSRLSDVALLPHEEAAEEEDLPELAESRGAPRAVLGEAPPGSDGQRRRFLRGQVSSQPGGQAVMETSPLRGVCIRCSLLVFSLLEFARHPKNCQSHLDQTFG